jgi:hypothetical protein
MMCDFFGASYYFMRIKSSDLQGKGRQVRAMLEMLEVKNIKIGWGMISSQARPGE